MLKHRFLLGVAGFALVHAAPALSQQAAVSPGGDASAVANGDVAPTKKPSATSADIADHTAAPQDGPSGDIVITGSRLRDPSFTAASPMQVLTLDRAVQRGIVSVTQMVQETPAANGTQQN